MSKTRNRFVLVLIFFFVFVIACANPKDTCNSNITTTNDFTKVYLVSCEEDNFVKYGLINEKGEYLVPPQYLKIKLTELEGHFFYIYRETTNGAETLVNLSTQEVLTSSNEITPIMYQQNFLIQSDNGNSVYDAEQDTTTLVDFENIINYDNKLMGYVNEKWYLLDNEYNISYEHGFSSKFLLSDNAISYPVFLSDYYGKTYNNIYVHRIDTKQGFLVLPFEELSILKHTKNHIVYTQKSNKNVLIYDINKSVTISFESAQNIIFFDDYYIVQFDLHYELYDYLNNQIFTQYEILDIIDIDTFIVIVNSNTKKLYSNENMIIVENDLSKLYRFSDGKIGLFNVEGDIDLYTSEMEFLVEIPSQCVNEYYSLISKNLMRRDNNFKNLPLILNSSCRDTYPDNIQALLVFNDTEDVVFTNGVNLYSIKNDGSIKNLYSIKGDLIYKSRS